MKHIIAFVSAALLSVTPAFANTWSPSSQELSQLILVDDVEYFYEVIESFRLDFPNASDEELNLYLKEFVVNYYANAPFADNYGELPYLRDRLNPIQRALFSENPAQGLIVIRLAHQATTRSERLFVESSLRNGNGDAFRHCYWNGLMKESINARVAKTWSDAHEDGVPDNPRHEREMDLFNNAQGYRLPAGENSESGCLRLTSNGSLRRLNGTRLVPTNGSDRR